MKDMLKKLMSAALVCCLLTGSMPPGAYASEGEPVPVPAAEEPAKEEPKKEEPKQEEPAKEEPKKEEPKQEEPAKEEPKKEEPKQEEPAKEEPKKEEPKQEEPKKEAPATEAPATEAPATEAPATEVPATEVPATEAPATEVPTTQAPAAEAPATEAPVENPDPVNVAGVGRIEDGVLYITDEEAVIREMPAAAPYKKIVICEDAMADFGKLEVEFPVVIEEKGILANGIFLEKITNDGTIENGEFREKVKNGSKGLILGGKYEEEIGKIDTEEMDFKKQFIFGKRICSRRIPEDWLPENSVTESEIRFDDEDIYEFGISADLQAAAPEAKGAKFTGLAAETAYAVFARIEVIDGDWVKLAATVSTAPAAAQEAPAANATETPAETEVPAADTTEAPVETEAPAADTTEAPAETEAPAADTTEAPAETEAPAADTTEAPAETEAPAADTTEAPAETEAPAADATEAPAEMEVPAEETEPAAQDVPADMMLAAAPAVFALRSAGYEGLDIADEETRLTAEEIAAANVKLEQVDAYKLKLSWTEGYEVCLEGGGETVYPAEDGWFHTAADERYRAYVRRAGGEDGAWTDAGLDAQPYYIRVRVVPAEPIEGETIRAIVETNLPEDEPLIYDWHACGTLVDNLADALLVQSGIDSSYTTTAADVGWDIRVSAYWEKNESVCASATSFGVSAMELPDAPELSFDYEGEVFTLTMKAEPRGDFKPGILNTTNGDEMNYVPESGEMVYDYALSQLEMAEGENTFVARLTDSSGRSVQGGSITLVRMPLTQEEIAAANVQLSGQSAGCAPGYELRAVDENGNICRMINGQFSNLVGGSNYILQLRRLGSNEEKRLGSAWTDLEAAITAVVPELVPLICSAPEISAMVNEARLGDVLHAVVYRMDENYILPDDAEIAWRRADNTGKDVVVATGDTYTVTAADVDHRLFLSITSAQEGWTIIPSGTAIPVRSEEISFTVDYEAETITAVLNREGDWNSRLSAAAGNIVYASGASTITAALDGLLGNVQATAEEITCTFTAADGSETISAVFTPKARPGFDGESVAVSAEQITAFSAQLNCSDSAYQGGLMPEGGGTYIWADETGLAEGLTPGSNYTVVLRKKGSNADACFASEAGAANAASGGLAVATPEALHAVLDVLERNAEDSPVRYGAACGGETETGNVSYSWYAVDMAGNEILLAETGNIAELALSADQERSLFFKRVKLVVKDNISGDTAGTVCEEYHVRGLSCAIDYVREAIIVSAPAAPAADCVLHVFGRSFAWPAAAPAVELALHYGSLPGAAEALVEGRLIEEAACVESAAFSCVIPARPNVDARAVEISADGANVNITGIPDGWRVGLAQGGREIQDALSIENGKAGGVIGDLGKPCYVLAQISADNAQQHFASRTAALKVIPAAFGFELKRCSPGGEAEALEYGVNARLGDALIVELSGEYENVNYRWLRGGVEIPGANGPIYQTVSEDMNAVITVEVCQQGASGVNSAAASAEVSAISFSMTPNYKEETLTFTAPCGLTGGWFLRVRNHSVSWEEGAVAQSYSLDKLGISIDGGATVDFALISGNAADASLGFEQFSLPGRADYTGADAVVRERKNTSVEFEEMPGTEFGLSPAGAAAPSAALGSGPVFTDLLPGVEYQVWMRAAATDTAFAGKWKAAQDTVTTAMPASVGMPTVEIDFIHEKARITAPDEIPDADLKNWSFSFDDINGDMRDGERTRSLDLAVGVVYNLISETQDRLVPVYLSKETEDGSIATQAILVNIPRRPEFAGSVAEAKVKLIGQTANSLAFSCAKNYEIVLKDADGFIYSEGDNKFTNLDPGYRHEVYLRNPAGDTYFASALKAMNAVASTLKFNLTVDKSSVAVGGTITASLETGGVNYPGLVYNWYAYGADGMQLVASGPNCTSYNPKADDLGCTLIVEVISQEADLQNWIVAGKVIAAVRPTPTMPAASDVPKATPTPTVSPTPTNGFITDWGSYYDDYDDYVDDDAYYFDGEPEADGQGYESSERLYDDYLGSDHGTDSIVFDEMDAPMDYELLPIYRSGSEDQNIAMVVAQPDDEGEVAARKLRIYLEQLNYLYNEKDISGLLFRNGDADALLSIGELLGGDAAKLAAHMLESDAVSVDLLDVDFDSMDEVVLGRYQRSNVYYEIGIAPVPLEDERVAWQISVWMYTNDGRECDASNLLYDFTVCLNVHGMFEEEEKDSFTQNNYIALMDMEDETGEEILLDSELVIVPDEFPQSMADEAEYFSVMMPVEDWESVEVYYESAIDLDFYRNYALTTYYAGPGAYLLAGMEDEESEDDDASYDEYDAYWDFDESEDEASYDEYDAYWDYEEFEDDTSYDEYDAYWDYEEDEAHWDYEMYAAYDEPAYDDEFEGYIGSAAYAE